MLGRWPLRPTETATGLNHNPFCTRLQLGYLSQRRREKTAGGWGGEGLRYWASDLVPGTAPFWNLRLSSGACLGGLTGFTTLETLVSNMTFCHNAPKTGGVTPESSCPIHDQPLHDRKGLSSTLQNF